MNATYYWVITRDIIGVDIKGIDGSDENVSKVDKSELKKKLGNRSIFSLYDDDGECYATGFIWGEYDGFEPLDDYGMPGLGCTAIKLNGEWV